MFSSANYRNTKLPNIPLVCNSKKKKLAVIFLKNFKELKMPNHKSNEQNLAGR